MSDELVRLARPADVDAVLALWEAARSAHAVSPDRRELVEQLAHEDSLLIAEAGDELVGELVGALIAAWDGWRGNMYRLAVRPEHRRTGVASALVRAGENRLRNVGCLRVTALVPHEDEAARSLWEAAGYVHDRLVQRYVRSL